MIDRTTTALLVTLDDGSISLRAPTVGIWEQVRGRLISEDGVLGTIEHLGIKEIVVSPVTLVLREQEGPRLRRRPVGYGDELCRGDRDVSIAPGAADADAGSEAKEQGGLLFRAPSSGRFYGRPSPDQPAFVSAGDTIEAGAVVCLLEVMKTFNRIEYGGPGMPAKAEVVEVIPADGDDLEAGDPVLRLRR